MIPFLSFFCVSPNKILHIPKNNTQRESKKNQQRMVSSCFTTFFLLISVFFFFFFFSEAQTAAIDEVLVVPEKYGILGSARISSDVKKEVDDAGVSSIVEARELRSSRKMKLITRKDRNVVEELNTYGTATTTTTTGEYEELEVSGGGVVGNTYHRKKNIGVWDDHHHIVAHNLKMRSRGPRRSSGFVAFSADYHIPKPHPPRNN